MSVSNILSEKLSLCGNKGFLSNKSLFQPWDTGLKLFKYFGKKLKKQLVWLKPDFGSRLKDCYRLLLRGPVTKFCTSHRTVATSCLPSIPITVWTKTLSIGSLNVQLEVQIKWLIATQFSDSYAFACLDVCLNLCYNPVILKEQKEIFNSHPSVNTVIHSNHLQGHTLNVSVILMRKSIFIVCEKLSLISLNKYSLWTLSFLGMWQY